MNSAIQRRHVHLGLRLDAIERIRRGEISLAEAAAELGVTPATVLHWMNVHADERTVRIEEVLVPPRVQSLTRRAQRLVALIAEADSTIRVLNRQLCASAPPRRRAPPQSGSTPRNLM
jgi:transposase-like protein